MDVVPKLYTCSKVDFPFFDGFCKFKADRFDYLLSYLTYWGLSARMLSAVSLCFALLTAILVPINAGLAVVALLMHLLVDGLILPQMVYHRENSMLTEVLHLFSQNIGFFIIFLAILANVDVQWIIIAVTYVFLYQLMVVLSSIRTHYNRRPTITLRSRLFIYMLLIVWVVVGVDVFDMVFLLFALAMFITNTMALIALLPTMDKRNV